VPIHGRGREGVAEKPILGAMKGRAEPDGTAHILATLTEPADGGIHTPVLGFH
jgi:hypothetical protein